MVLPDWFTRLVDPEGGDGLATVAKTADQKADVHRFAECALQRLSS